MKKIFLLVGILSACNFVQAEEKEDFKHWKFNSKLSTTQRESGRITEEGADWGLPDDNWEDGDTYLWENSLTYAFDKKTSIEFSLRNEYHDNNEIGFKKNPLPQGNYNYENIEEKDHQNSRQYTVTLEHDFGKGEFLGKTFKNSGYFGYKYWETDAFGREGKRIKISNNKEDDLTFKQKNISWSNKEHHRIFLGTKSSTKLNDLVNFSLATEYRYIKDRFANPIKENGPLKAFSYQHRFYLIPTFTFKLGENTSFKFENGLQVRDYIAYTDSKNTRRPLNRGYWEPEYTLEHRIDLGNGVRLTLPLTWWAEFRIWESDTLDKDFDKTDEAEINFLPKLSKTFKFNESTKLTTTLSAGYVYGYNSNGSPKTTAYKGWEGTLGMNFTYEF